MNESNPKYSRTHRRDRGLCLLVTAMFMFSMMPFTGWALESDEETTRGRPVYASETPTESDSTEDIDVDIIIAEDRVVYEYRVNGVITAIKVVPKRGRPYYMVPVDESPHYEINHDSTLYPKWVLLKW